MSKLIKNPLLVPKNVTINWVGGNCLAIKGIKGTLKCKLNSKILTINLTDNRIVFIREREDKYALSQIGTIYSLIKNAIFGVSQGYYKKLILFGIGYKAIIKEKILNLSLGFSHSINYNIPNEIKATCLTPTEILLEGIDKQLVGQTAANIYFLRPPDVYKGKGIRYENQLLIMKETKKK